MPQVRLPVPRNRLWALGLLALGAAAVIVTDAFRRRRPFGSTVGGPLVLARTDGVLLRGGFRATPLGPDRLVRWTRIGAHDGAGEANWQFSGLSLRADGAVFAVSTIEYFTGGFDMRVSIHDSWAGNVLFPATDNSHPTNVWRGDEPDIPALLQEQQAIIDDEWREWLQVDPEVPRPVLSAFFADPDSRGELVFGGWTAAGHCLVRGMSMLLIDWEEERRWDQPAPWWGVAGPAAGGQWGWIARGHGEPPAIHAAVPQPALARRVTVVDGQLLVDGVAQTDAALSAGVLAVDGPFA